MRADVPIPKLRAFRISEVCDRTGLGRTSIYAAIKSGSLKARKCGRTTIVLADDLQAWLMMLPALQRPLGGEEPPSACTEMLRPVRPRTPR
jgi:excisionase family DNA binding protein